MYQDHLEAEECFPGGDLEDFGHLDGDFITVTQHMITFWNPYDQTSTLGSHHQDHQEAKECPLGCFGPHMG